MLLDEFFFQHQSIFVPHEVWLLRVDIVLLHATFKQSDNVTIIGVLGEAQPSAVVHKLLELFWLILAELLNLDLLLLFLDVGVLLGLGSSWKSLPWECAFQEIEEHVTDGLKVISSGLLVANMGVDRSVSSGSSKVLAISERNVLSIRTLVAFGQSKIDDVDSVLGLLSASNQKVVRFDVSMNDSLFMNNLDSLDHLHGNVKYSIEVELSAALLEQVLERFTKHVHHHDMVHFTIVGLLVTHEM